MKSLLLVFLLSGCLAAEPCYGVFSCVDRSDPASSGSHSGGGSPGTNEPGGDNPSEPDGDDPSEPDDDSQGSSGLGNPGNSKGVGKSGEDPGKGGHSADDGDTGKGKGGKK